MGTASASANRYKMNLKIILIYVCTVTCLVLADPEPEPEPDVHVQAKFAIDSEPPASKEEPDEVSCGEDDDAECVDPVHGTKDCPPDMYPAPGYCSEDAWICCKPINSTLSSTIVDK